MPIAKKNIPQDFLDQMKNNLTKADEPEVTEEIKTEIPVTENIETTVPSSVPAVEEEKKDKYADVMNIRLSKGRRNEIKAFCSGCGVSVTQYIESSFEFLQNEVAAGRIVISKGGIKKVE